ncbi:MAG TPA: response regulator, partial [Bacteroidales bacterium]|nr:response regulator [Bacteroidales bacterium]
ELAGINALLVDDDAMNRALGQIILEGFNMEVSLASEGREAMEIYKKGLFDVVLLDIHMPDISGFEVANFIRNEANDEDVKIIAVTADSLREDEVLSARDKIDDVLIKPYRENHDFFNDMIETFIENAYEGIEEIRNAFEKNEWEEMKETAHRLIPSFKHLKINLMVSDLVEIKSQASGNREKELMKSLIENMEELTRKVIEQLKGEKYSG